MRLRANNHGASAAAKAFTVAVMAAAIVAQLASISHEMTVRHVRCAEHGELTHVVTMIGDPAMIPGPGPNAAVRAQGNKTAEGHEHCGVAFTLEGSSCTPSTGGAIATVTPPALPPLPRAIVVLGDRAVILASAPKTSPPVA